MSHYIAHRGLKMKNIKENSLEAIHLALKNINYAGFECDIRTTKDHVFVAVHNPIIKEDIISQSTYQELKKKYNLTTLEEILKLKSNKIFLLEIKESNLDTKKFLKIINAYPKKKIYIMSFHNSIVKKLKQKKQTYKLGVLNYVLNSEEDYSEYDFICLLEAVVTPKLIAFFENQKIETFLYGIHNLEKLVSVYKNSYFITDEYME